MTQNADIIFQLLTALTLLLYLNQRQLKRRINQLQNQIEEFTVISEEQPVQKIEIESVKEVEKPQPKVDFAKRMRSSGKMWQPSLQQQQKAMIEDMVSDDAEEGDEEAPQELKKPVAKPRKKKATAPRAKTPKKSTPKSSAKKKEKSASKAK